MLGFIARLKLGVFRSGFSIGVTGLVLEGFGGFGLSAGLTAGVSLRGAIFADP